MNDKLGLIGQNCGGSLSPWIHKISAQCLGLDINYSILDLPRDQIEKTLADTWDQGWLGLNITAPYKTQVAQILGHTELTSVNTLYRKKGASFWEATSTDGQGFLRALGHWGTTFQRWVILGAGGAAQGLLALPGTGKVILNRSFRQTPYPCLPLDQETLKGVLESDPKKTLLIQATSAPLYQDDLSYLTPALEGFQGAYLDMTYGHPSALLSYCQTHKILCQDGFPMLAEQAFLSQKFWWGKNLTYEKLCTFKMPSTRILP
jgi:shikimate dehydrogenase